MTVSIDVVIPTYGRPREVVRLVAALLPLPGPGDGIIVVEQGSGQQPPVLPPPVRRLHLPTPNLPAARNAGVRSSNADVVLFLDDDVEPCPGLLDAHRSCYSDPAIAAVAGFVDDPLFDRAQPFPSRVDLATGACSFNFALSRSRATTSAMGANMSFRRSHLLSVNGFDHAYRGNALWEDVDCCLRIIAAGHRLHFCADARVVHLRTPGGGCRAHAGPGYLFHQFANTAYFCARFALRSHYGSWLVYWKYRLEYLSRRDTAAQKKGHDPVAVLAGIAGAATGLVRFLHKGATRPRIDKTALHRAIERALQP